MPTNNKSNQGKQDLPSQRQEKMGEQQRSSQQVSRNPQEQSQQRRDIQQGEASSDRAPQSDAGRDFDGSQQGKPTPVTSKAGKASDVEGTKDMASNSDADLDDEDELQDEGKNEDVNNQVTGRHPSQRDRDLK